jgi:hypothetical protein
VTFGKTSAVELISSTSPPRECVPVWTSLLPHKYARVTSKDRGAAKSVWTFYAGMVSA